MNPNAVNIVPTILVCVIIGLCFLGRIFLLKGFILGLLASGSFEKEINQNSGVAQLGGSN